MQYNVITIKEADSPTGRKGYIMKTMHVIARIPINYNDFGVYAIKDAGEEKFDELIAKRLPYEAEWCGNEILAPVDSGIEIDINEIIEDAAEEMLRDYCDSEFFEEW